MIQSQILKLVKIKTIFFVFVFTALSVATPLAAHYFWGPAMGRMFLPMHFFVMTGALLLGWRAGFAIGILTPLISYSVSGMPMLPVLPFITIEVATYGLFAGLLSKQIKNIWLALGGAMIIGRLFLWLGLMILPTKLVAGAYLFSAIKDGWRGILLQALLAPIAVIFIRKFLKDEKGF